MKLTCPTQSSIAACDNPLPSDMATVLATVAANSGKSSDREQLERVNKWFEVALNNMARGLSMFDAEQRLIVCNKLYRDIYNLPEELTRPGTPLAGIVRYHFEQETGRDTPEDRENQRKWIERHVAELKLGKTFAHTQQLANGKTILVTNQPLSDGGWVDLQEDITQRREAEDKIAWLARHDALTEVPNRFHFHEQLEAALKRVQPGDGLAVHWIDLDNFKNINDEFGHPVGDALLKSIGARLHTTVRRPDFVGRLGGDEFAIVQSNVTREAQAAAFADRLLSVLNEPHQLMGHTLSAGASIGIALMPQHGTTADELMKHADIALYRTKAIGRGNYQFFDPAASNEQQTRRRLETDLRQALSQGQFVLHYQPILGAQTKQVRSCEALIRWQHPEYGLIPPNDFIPLAEETGLIVPIGQWVLHRACKDAATWPEEVGVTVNLSASQFSASALDKTVEVALALSRLAAKRLELEITESVLLQDDPTTLAVLHRLRGIGVRIALDDFGTAFASLSYLRSFPFDTIKIDRSFVRDLPKRSDCLAIVEAVAGLARKLNMNSVAEGIETEAQLTAARDSGCDEVQGYLFNRPMPANEIKAVLDRCGGTHSEDN
jgi:diguanylate cyclase (GGDEF)-like protein